MKNLSLVRMQRREQTRRSLMDAAIEVFSVHGYERATIDLVAQRAGYSKGAFYVHFDSKEAMLIEVLSDAMGTHDVRGASGVAGAIDGLSTLVTRRPYWPALAAEFSAHAWRNVRVRSGLDKLWEGFLARLEESLLAEGHDAWDAHRRAGVLLNVFRGAILDPSTTEGGIRGVLESALDLLGPVDAAGRAA